MKNFILLFFAFATGISSAQQYCPDTFVSEVIASQTVPTQISVFNASENCWSSTTEIILSNTTFPTGLDVFVRITAINGASGSIVDLNTLNPVSVGDSIFLRKNNLNYDLEFHHLTSSGLEFEIILSGYPTEFGEYHDCDYDVGGLFYPPFCTSFGIYVYALEECQTCQTADKMELSVSESYSIFPNPVENSINIDVDLSNTLKYAILKPTGETILDGILPENGIVDVSKLESGAYILYLKNEDNLQLISKILIKL